MDVTNISTRDTNRLINWSCFMYSLEKKMTEAEIRDTNIKKVSDIQSAIMVK